MNINLVSYTSTLDNLSSHYQAHEKLLNELELHYNINYCTSSQLDKVSLNDFTIIFVVTGGVEHLIVQDIEKLPRPIILLTDGLFNSLAASLEVSTWLRQRGIRNEILHGDIRYIKQRIDSLAHNFAAQEKIKQEKIGIIGSPSPWLLSSGVEYYLVKQRWGLNFNNIPLGRVYDYFHETTLTDVIEEVELLKKQSIGCKDCNDKAIINSMRFYHALKRLCDEEVYLLSTKLLQIFRRYRSYELSSQLSTQQSRYNNKLRRRFTSTFHHARY